MATFDPSDLAEAVLREMAVIDATEEPDAVDETFVIGVYEQKYAELQAPGLELVYWKQDEIPDAIFLTLRDLVINECSGAFGEPTPPETKDARETITLKRLRRHVARDKTGNPNRADYF